MQDYPIFRLNSVLYLFDIKCQGPGFPSVITFWRRKKRKRINLDARQVWASIVCETDATVCAQLIDEYKRCLASESDVTKLNSTSCRPIPEVDRGKVEEPAATVSHTRNETLEHSRFKRNCGLTNDEICLLLEKALTRKKSIKRYRKMKIEILLSEQEEKWAIRSELDKRARVKANIDAGNKSRAQKHIMRKEGAFVNKLQSKLPSLSDILRFYKKFAGKPQGASAIYSPESDYTIWK